MRRLTLILLLILILPVPVHAWSTYTHGAITLEAAPAELLPTAAEFSILPDVSTNFFSPAAKDPLYSKFHSAGFAEAMRQAAHPQQADENDRTALCGYLSHLLADPVAHTGQGYPNARKIFNNRAELDHYVAYLFLDLLCYDRYFRNYSSRLSGFVPDADGELAARAAGIYSANQAEEFPLQAATVQKKLLLYRASIALEQAIFDTIIESNPELFAELKEEFSDGWLGVNGQGGFLDAVAAVRQGLALPEARHDEDPDGGFGDRLEHGFIRVGYEVVGKISAEAEFLRTGKLTSGHLKNLVDRLFRDQSANSQAMGKLLSLLLFQRDLTWAEIVARVDSGVSPPNPRPGSETPDPHYQRYRDKLAKLRQRQSSWLRFVPFSDGQRREECALAFADWRQAADQARLTAEGIASEENQVIQTAAAARWQAWRELQQTSSLNIPARIQRQAVYDRLERTHQLLREAAVARQGARRSGDTQRFQQVNQHLQEGLATLDSSSRSPRGLAALFTPRRWLYQKAYTQTGETVKTMLAPVLAMMQATGAPAMAQDSGEVQFSAVDFPQPSGPAEALALLQRAYKEYTEILNQPAAQRDESRLQILAREIEFYQRFVQQ